MDRKKLEKAMRLAIDALSDQKREFAFDAYLVEKFGSNAPGALRAKRRKDEIEEAINQLNELMSTFLTMKR